MILKMKSEVGREMYARVREYLAARFDGALPDTGTAWAEFSLAMNEAFPMYAVDESGWRMRIHAWRNLDSIPLEATERFSHELERAMAVLRMNQTEFAREIGVSAAELSRLKNGYRPWTAALLNAIIRVAPDVGVPPQLGRAVGWEPPPPSAAPRLTTTRAVPMQQSIDFENAPFASRARAAQGLINEAMPVLNSLDVQQLRRLVSAVHRALSEFDPLAEVRSELQQLRKDKP